MHIFDWEAILMVPTATGRRSVRTSAGRSGDYYHIWFARAPEVLRHFQQTLFHPSDPISGDATPFLYTLLLTPPAVRQYCSVITCGLPGHSRRILSLIRSVAHLRFILL